MYELLPLNDFTHFYVLKKQTVVDAKKLSTVKKKKKSHTLSTIFIHELYSSLQKVLTVENTHTFSWGTRACLSLYLLLTEIKLFALKSEIMIPRRTCMTQ